MSSADASPGRPPVPRGRPLPPPPPRSSRPASRTPPPSRAAGPRAGTAPRAGGSPAVRGRAVPPPRARGPVHPPGPLRPPPRRPMAVRRPTGRVRRFIRRYGWRAYAIPLLTIATVAALIDLVMSAPSSASASSSSAATATSSAPAPSSQAAAPTPAHVSASAAGDEGPTAQPPVPAEATFVQQGAGSVSVVDGTSQVYGAGPPKRFVVEVEDGIGVDGLAFAHAVETTLGDPRSWGKGGQMSFQRVGAAEAGAGQYDFRVSLVSPGSMERYCPGVGTGGYTSCRYGERAVINLARWETAVPDYAGDIATYRLYVVNHEVGHALGQHHEQCPGAGQVAPVMQQQTLGLNGCLKNAWPYP